MIRSSPWQQRSSTEGFTKISGDQPFFPIQFFYIGKNLQVKLDTEQASVYKNPNLKGKVIATLAGGTAVSVREHAKGIHQIQLSNGETGYLSSDYLSFQAPIPEAAPPSQEYFIYEVKAGDTLWKIAEQFLGEGKRYPEIVQLNNLSSDDITPGMRLKIPGAESTSKPEMSFVEYTVKRGDSLWKISSKLTDIP